MTTVVMKRLGKTHQISAQSHAEMVSRLAQFTERLVRADETYLGRKLKPGHVLNGLVLLFLDHTEDEQLELGIRAVKRLEAWAMDLEPPEGGLNPGPSDPPSGTFRPHGSPAIQYPRRKRQPKAKDQV